MEDYISVSDFSKPHILVAGKDYLLVYKPPRMHTVPLEKSKDDNLLTWCCAEFPEIAELTRKDNFSSDEAQTESSGKQTGDGGVLHRLDFETQGLILIARTQSGMDSLVEQQKSGKLIKEYIALTGEHETELPGFPDEEPKLHFWVFREKRRIGDSINIKSAFRPFGPGRKAVRPVLPNLNVPYGNTLMVKNHEMDIALDGSRPYVTEIINAQLFNSGGESLSVVHEMPKTGKPCLASFRIRIARGFRHQLRCHLAWVGRPILNDGIYGGNSYGKGFLGLRACSISFNDPVSDEKRTYSIAPMNLEDI